MSEKEGGEVRTVVADTPQAVEEQVARAVEEAKTASAATTTARPMIFIEEGDTVTIDVNVMFRRDNGEVLSVFSTDVKVNMERLLQFLGHQVLQFTFSRPGYSQVARYRQRSTVVYPDTNTTVVDTSKVRDFLICYHLKGWNLTDKEGKPIEMKFDPNGAMANETLNEVYSLHSSIIDVVMTTLERRLLLN